MKKIITNIEINNKYIYITYYDNTISKVIYNETNKNNLIEDLKQEKNTLKEYKTFSLKVIIYSNFILLIDLISSILCYTYINNFIFNLFVSILLFDTVLFNIMFFNEFTKDFKNVKNILELIDHNYLPTEKEYLNNRKIVNIKDYITKKQNQTIFNYYDPDYPGYIPKENKKIVNDSPGKILEFKRK